ncbi:MAG: YwaF family protein [Tissierellia bacterium]|nr:YwaF family protein [Tissierellia bacterium]
MDWLPFPLCSFGILVAGVYGLWPNELLFQSLFWVFMPGAMMAIISPNWTNWPKENILTTVGFLIHAGLMAMPIGEMARGHKPSVKWWPKLAAFLAILGGAIFSLNKALNANFMYLMEPSKGSILEVLAEKAGSHFNYLVGMGAIVLIMWCILASILYTVNVVQERIREHRHS